MYERQVCQVRSAILSFRLPGEGGAVVRTLSAALCPILVCMFLATQALAQDDRARTTVPKKGDRIIVKGCLQGQTLSATETRLESAEEDAAGTLYTAFTYQLKGNKDLLKKLRSEHQGRVVQVTGELKSNLQIDTRRGVQIGNTRIVVGANPTAADPMVRQAAEPLPVLEVKSFEGVNVECGR